MTMNKRGRDPADLKRPSNSTQPPQTAAASNKPNGDEKKLNNGSVGAQEKQAPQ